MASTNAVQPSLIAVADSRRATRRTAWYAGQALIAPLILIVVWQIVTTLFPSPFFPPPLRIIEAGYQQWFSGPLILTQEFFENVLPSLGRLLLGWLIACALGIGLGLAIGLQRWLGDYISPIVEFVRSIPPPAYLPIFLVLLGGDWEARVLFIAFGLVWYVMINTISGVASVDSLQRETARAFRIHPFRRVSMIVLPAALPQIFSGVRYALSGALILMVVSELMFASNGVGYELIQSQRTFAIVDMWSAMFLLGLLGYGLNVCLQVFENRVLSWHIRSRKLDKE